MIPLNVNIYERGAGGVPSTTFLMGLSGVIDSYNHTIDDHIGFETMSVSFACTLEDALDWLMNGLMRSTVVTSPDAEVVWEGFLETVDADFGGEHRSVSLRDMANYISVRFTTVLGAATTLATIADTDSEALYGRKYTVLTLPESDGTEAGHYAATMLAKLKDPQSAPSANVATGDLGEIRITLSFAGWYAALDWVYLTDTSTTKTTTTTQITTLLGTYNALNNFFSTSTANIVPSGITAVEYSEYGTTFRQKFESLLGRGNGANPYAWGVYEDREFHANVYAGATPSTITYQRYIGESVLRDAAGGVVPSWNARPNAMYQAVELLDIAPVSTAKDSAARFYVARVSCSIAEGSIALTLEPSEPSDLAAILVTKHV